MLLTDYICDVTWQKKQIIMNAYETCLFSCWDKKKTTKKAAATAAVAVRSSIEILKSS